MDGTSHKEQFNTTVRQLTEKNLAMWRDIPDAEPDFSRRFTPWQQRENERQLEIQLKRYPLSFGTDEDVQDPENSPVSFDMIKAIIGSYFSPHEGLSDNYFEESEKVTRRFMKDTKIFDPSLSQGDIHQALRNLWVFNSIQMIVGREIALTPSSFAYSLLYPYTDNGLDSSARSSDEKQAYIRWLGQWLLGDKYRTIDDWTGKTAELLMMIEKEYPPQKFSDVHLSLSAIHQAQSKSLLLHDIQPGCDEESLTAITIEKGGTSVLADGYLAAGRLNNAEADSFFEYGVLLQLVDDLRDIDEDRVNAHSTPFSRIAEQGSLDSAVRRLLFFVKHSAEELSSLNRHHAYQIKEMVEQSCSFLILETAARHHEFYSTRFLKSVECWMPLRPAFLNELHSEIETRQTQSTRYARATYA
jgi:hypothetical protein